MSIKEIKSATLYKEYAVEIPYQEINGIIDEKINEIQPTVSIPGFRKGKAPVSIVRKKYEDNIISEAIDRLVQDKTKNLLDEKNLKPFIQPRVDLKKFEKNQPIEVEIKVNLEPEIKLKDFKKINLTNYEINLDKQIIDKNYKEFLNNQKKYIPITNSREIKKTDRVILNLSSENETVPDFLKSQKNLPIIINSDLQILPDLGSKLLSKKLKKGDKDKFGLDISKSIKSDKEFIADFDIEIVEIEESTPFKVDKPKDRSNTLKKVKRGKTPSPAGISIAGRKKVVQKRKTQKRSDTGASDMLKLVVMFNQKLPDAIVNNMGPPALTNQTGRFANSVRVTDITKTPQGFPSVGYTYQKNPYQTFESGYRQGSPEYDPRNLINKSIREVAVEFAIGRFYTRRV